MTRRNVFLLFERLVGSVRIRLLVDIDFVECVFVSFFLCFAHFYFNFVGIRNCARIDRIPNGNLIGSAAVIGVAAIVVSISLLHLSFVGPFDEKRLKKNEDFVWFIDLIAFARTRTRIRNKMKQT